MCVKVLTSAENLGLLFDSENHEICGFCGFLQLGPSNVPPKCTSL